MEVIHTIGRRKTSVARLYLSKGKGSITVNKKKYTEFWTDMLFLSIKKGDKFGPFGKLY